MQRLRLAFRMEEDDRFVVMTERDSEASREDTEIPIETIYDHEDTFLKLLIAADLDEETTRCLVVGVVLSVANPERRSEQIPVSMSQEQCHALRLKLPESRHVATDTSKETAERMNSHSVFPGNADHFHDFLMNSPTPFIMLSGPEHMVTFINLPYVKILRRATIDQILGLPILEAIPELRGQQCLSYLERVYETGAPQVRLEMLNCFRQPETGRVDEVYFDIVYHPVRDSAGSVSGVMAQATDVTERVLARQVSEHREQQLYRLWAELETIYSVSPAGIAMVDAADLKLLRLNRLQAAFLKGTMADLMGKLLPEVDGVPNELLSLIRRAVGGEKIVDASVEMAAEEGSQGRRLLSVSVWPSLNTSGVVETVTFTSLEVKSASERDRTLVEQLST